MKFTKATMIGFALVAVVGIPFFMSNLLKTENTFAISKISDDIKANPDPSSDTINNQQKISNPVSVSKNIKDTSTNVPPKSQTYRLGYVNLYNNGTLFIKSGTIVSDEGSFITSATGTTENCGNLYVKGDWTNNGSYVTNTGKIIFWGGDAQVIDGTSNTTIFNAEINNAGGVTLNNNTTVSNNLDLIDGKVDLNSKTLSITNTATTGITYTNGFLLSEKTNNSSKVKWTMNTTTGSHVIPFGTASLELIPLTINLTAGNIGDVTVSTYPTAANNLPIPVTPDSVFSIINMAGVDNSANMVDRFWQIDKNGASGTSTITFTYLDAEIPANGPSPLNSQRYNNTTKRWEDFLAGQTQNIPANTVTTPGITGYGAHALVLNNSPLPIELLDFTAEMDDDKVKLTWSTASEINSDYFTIERSFDGIQFEDVKNVKAAGNSTNILNYFEYDEDPYRGTSYYRLKETDYDYSFTYSKIRIVKNNTIKKLFVKVYPNPAKSEFNLSISTLDMGQVVVLVIDPLGQFVYRNEFNIENGDNNFKITSETWSRGIFHLRVIIDGKDEIVRTIVLN